MRFNSRDYHWYALTVAPQKELAIERILHGEGFATFVPMTQVYRWDNRAARARGKKRAKSYPLIPGYVFLGMNGRTPGWGRVLCFMERLQAGSGEDWTHPGDRVFPLHHARRGITGIIGVGGEPAEVPHDSRGPGRPGLRDMMWRYSQGRFKAPDHERWMQTHREFRVGDQAMTEDELFCGRVVEIGNGRAKLLVDLFGSMHEVDASLEKLVAVP